MTVLSEKDTDLSAPSHGSQRLKQLLANPALVLLISANMVNLGNLAFNIVLSRLMGPEQFGDLSFLLTIKLAVLCIMSAVQFEIARRVASAVSSGASIVTFEASKSGVNLLGVAAVALVLPTAAFFLTVTIILFDVSLSDRAMGGILFLLAIPFLAPLCLLRGLSQGVMDLKHIVLSAQAEMAIRFFGALVAWYLGAGLTGICLAVVVSIIAGWWLAAPRSRRSIVASRSRLALFSQAETECRSQNSLGCGLFLAALPWVFLQLGQVISLDADFIAVKLFMDAKEGGHAAVSVLVQRILFFGSFGLASAMLPLAAGASTRKALFNAVQPVFLLFLLTAVPAVLMLVSFSEIFVVLGFGSTYLAAAPFLPFSAVSGAAFVIVYLIATLFMARGRFFMGYAVFALSVLQFCILLILPFFIADMEPSTLIAVKTVLLVGFAIFFIGFAVREFSKL